MKYYIAFRGKRCHNSDGTGVQIVTNPPTHRKEGYNSIWAEMRESWVTSLGLWVKGYEWQLWVRRYESEEVSVRRSEWEEVQLRRFNMSSSSSPAQTKRCQYCGATMVLRVSKSDKNRGKPFWKCLTSYVSFNLKNMYVGEKKPMSNSDRIIFHIWCLQLGSHQLQWIRMGWCNLRWSRTSRWHVWC